ncbi:MAG: GNAT family N-acetyltransferase [Candidatus Izemoplasmatales bacterium]|jgi:ribosomal protein S18 acetylase RimI-like enzyme|nr:GNAT family N-acetyltransferase [Candidatus Izemoplasmatales bacterium]
MNDIENEIELRNPDEEEFNVWFSESTNRQALDRSYVNDSDFNLELAKLHDLIPQVLPQGKDTPRHYFRILSTALNKNIGFIWFGVMPGIELTDIILMDIIVKKDFQGIGLGKKMLQKMHEEMKREGYQRIILDVLNHNPAKYLYTKLGYQPIRETDKDAIMVINL